MAAVRGLPLAMRNAWGRVERQLRADPAERRAAAARLRAAERAVRQVGAWRRAEAVDDLGPPAGVDELLARAYAADYAPVLRLYGALMEASVSCALYAPMHAAHGQLPGLPQPCGVPQRTACGGSAECAGERQGGAAVAAAGRAVAGGDDEIAAGEAKALRPVRHRQQVATVDPVEARHLGAADHLAAMRLQPALQSLHEGMAVDDAGGG